MARVKIINVHLTYGSGTGRNSCAGEQEDFRLDEDSLIRMIRSSLSYRQNTWLKLETSWDMSCSKCGQKIYEPYNLDETKFCSHCGAKL